MTTIHLFLKFGKSEHIQDLYENGTIYCNSVEYFKMVEDDELRGDNYEGASFIKNYPPGKFRISIAGKEVDQDFNYLNLHIKEAYEKTLGNIFSLYSITSKDTEKRELFKVDLKNKKFGDKFLLIKDNPTFLNLIEQELKKKRLKFKHGFVEYYDRHKFTGQVDVFHKPDNYSYQNEFRIYVRRKSEKPLVLQIGSLKNIAVLHDIDALDTLEVRRKNNNTQQKYLQKQGLTM
jgi:hypothetical protein